jgi:3-oxoacyl-[acyl-carrier protein] reductase
VIALDFSGRTALVVGGSTGIGNAAAQMFRAAGATVHVTGTRASAADYAETDGDLTGLTYHRLDIGDRAAVAAFDPGLDRLDALVIAAGMVMYRRAEFEIENFERVLSANLTGFMQLATKFRPALAAAGGSIVNVGSVASFRGVVGQPAYSASKGGLLTLTKSLAMAFAADGIRVNLIAPGLIRTKMTEVTWADERRAAATVAAIPLKRLGEPRDVAGAILFLCSDLAGYITGESILIDGGATA